MHAEIKKHKDLWDWCMRNLKPRARWRFDGPAKGDKAVILEIYNLHWDQTAHHYDVEFGTIRVVETDGTEREAAPNSRVALPDWFKACQTGPTPLFMPSTFFKEQVDAGRIHRLTPA